MPRTESIKEGIARRGEAMYEDGIRRQVETEFSGKILAIDVNSGDYEIDETTLPAADRLRLRHPEAEVYVLRIGHNAVYSFHGLPSMRAKQ